MLTNALEHVEKFWQFLKKLKLSCDPTITLLGIYPRELKTCPTKLVQMVVSALPVIAKKRKQPKTPISWWVLNQMSSVCTAECHQSLSGWSTVTCHNMIEPWQCLSQEGRQTPDAAHYMNPFIWNTQNMKIERIECQGLRRGKVKIGCWYSWAGFL